MQDDDAISHVKTGEMNVDVLISDQYDVILQFHISDQYDVKYLAL